MEKEGICKLGFAYDSGEEETGSEGLYGVVRCEEGEEEGGKILTDANSAAFEGNGECGSQ